MQEPIETQLARAEQLRAAGRPEDARALLIELAGAYPSDGAVQYAAARIHDALGYEAEAVPYYQAALRADLHADALHGAYLGLGSTLRTLGRYQESLATLQEGLARIPGAADLRVFLAMTQYNLGDHHAAVAGLLELLAETSAAAEIRRYERAIRFYAADLNRTW